jgi:transcriptional regulator with XRE-family HTH domain
VPESENYDLADYVRKQRKLRDWTQEELAEVSGIGVSTIRQIETRAVQRPDDDTLKKFANAFDKKFSEVVSHIPGFQVERTAADAMPGIAFPTRRASDAGVSLRAREMAEAYDKVPALAQIAIDAILRAFAEVDRGH